MIDVVSLVKEIFSTLISSPSFRNVPVGNQLPDTFRAAGHSLGWDLSFMAYLGQTSSNRRR
jgi:hypothetical protein